MDWNIFIHFIIEMLFPFQHKELSSLQLSVDSDEEELIPEQPKSRKPSKVVDQEKSAAKKVSKVHIRR